MTSSTRGRGTPISTPQHWRDPLAVASAKRDAGLVAWLDGTARDLPGGPFDAAVMTGHAVQCLLTDDEILETLVEVRRRLAPTGRFLFETRNPARKAWLDWQSPNGPDAVASGAGPLLTAWTLVEVRNELVTFDAASSSEVIIAATAPGN